MSISSLLPKGPEAAHAPVPRSTVRWIRVLAWSLAAIYVATAVWKLLAFDATVESFGRLLYAGPRLGMALAVALVVAELVLGILIVFESTLRGAALLSVAFSSAALLTHAYLLWFGEMVPCACAGRILQAVQGLEQPIMFGLSLLMLAASTALYLRAPARATSAALPVIPGQ